MSMIADTCYTKIETKQSLYMQCSLFLLINFWRLTYDVLLTLCKSYEIRIIPPKLNNLVDLYTLVAHN